MSYPFLVDLLYRIIRLLVVGAVAVFFFRYGYLSIESLSGHETSAALGLDLKVSLKRTMICLAFGMVGVSGLVYGVVQHTLRRSKVGRLARRNKALERRIDPGRQSSEGAGR